MERNSKITCLHVSTPVMASEIFHALFLSDGGFQDPASPFRTLGRFIYQIKYTCLVEDFERQLSYVSPTGKDIFITTEPTERLRK